MLEQSDREQVYLETDKPMKPSKTFSVRLKFEYNLSTSLQGFYFSSYTDTQGITRYCQGPRGIIIKDKFPSLPGA